MVIARGGAADAPENTIAAFELALEQGADGLEIPVHLSRDGQPVVIRDFTLERTSDGAGPVAAFTMRELKRLDAGGWAGRRYRGHRIQTLQEVFERFRSRTRFWVELRGGSDLYPDIGERVVSTIEVYEVLDRTLVQSLDHRALTAMRERSSEVRLGALVIGAAMNLSPDVPHGLQAVSFDLATASEAGVRGTREAGLESYVFTVREPVHVDRLAGWKLDGIITDRPGPVAARLGRSVA